jgi:ATP-binding cassette subfamily B protein
VKRPSTRFPVIFRLVARLRRSWPVMVLAYGCLLGSVAFTVVVPRLVQLVIDRGIGISVDGTAHGNVTKLSLYASLIVIAAVVRGMFAYGQSYLAEVLSQRVAYDLRNDLYDHIQRLSFSFHDRSQTGQIMSRATTDVEVSRQFLSMGMLRATYTFVLFFVVLILMLRLDVVLALIMLVSMPLVAIRAIIVNRKVRPLSLEAQQKTGEETAVLQENLIGVRAVRAFAREDEEHAKFQAANWAVRERNLEAARITSFNQPFMLFLLNCSSAALLLFGGYAVIHQQITLGALVAFMQYRVQLAAPVRTLGFVSGLLARASASGERIFEILDTESDVQDRPGAVDVTSLEGHVRFEHVSFGYDTRREGITAASTSATPRRRESALAALKPVVEEIDIDAAPGQTVALLGTTGSGKSTILNLLPRFYDVTAGRITIDGIDLRDMTVASLRRNVGIVLQDIFLFSATIRDNISYGRPDATQAEIEQAGKAARIHDFIMSLPDGYDTWVGERGVTLSGGQKQRVAIARTLLLDPRVLVLDDSTSSVDMETEYLIQQALHAVMQGRTTFVIAHRLRTIRDADQILVLDRGRIVQRGRHAALVHAEGPYREIYDLQFRDQEVAERGMGSGEWGMGDGKDGPLPHHMGSGSRPRPKDASAVSPAHSPFPTPHSQASGAS